MNSHGRGRRGGRFVVARPVPLFRSILRHPVIALCNVLGIALGVAVFLAMQAANGSANRAFAASIDLVAGRAHAELRAAGSGFDEQVFPVLRALPEVAHATPLVEGYAVLPDHPGEFLHLVGIDLFTAPPFQTASFRPEAWDGLDTTGFLGEPGRMVVAEAVAAAFGWREGGRVRVEIDGREAELTVARVVPQSAIEGAAGAGGGGRLALLDIGWAQEWLGQAGRLTAIQFLLHEPSRLDQFLAEVPRRVALPAQARLAAPAARSAQVQTMIRGFQLNLGALSMVSVLVGVLLVYNTVAASTVRQRKEIGILRAIGASRGLVTRHFLAEALVYAVPGVLLGWLAGAWLADLLVGGVARTLSSRYLLVRVDQAMLEPGVILAALGYGLAAALAGAWLPAREAARADPVAALHPGTALAAGRRRRRGLAMVALGLGLATPLCGWLALRVHPLWSFAACFACVCAFACLAPACARLAAAAVLRVCGHAGRLLPLGTEAFERSLHRTGATMAALLAAVAMLVGVATMVGSFRRAVDDWIGASMDADLYLSPAANEVLGMRAFLPAEVVAALDADPRFDGVQGYREETVELDQTGPTVLTAVDPRRAARFQILAALPGDPAGLFVAPGHCFANESFARRHGLAAGDTLSLPTPGGPRPLRVAAVFRDYSDDRGRLFVPLAAFQGWWGDLRLHSLGLRLAGPADPEPVAAALRQELAADGRFALYTRGGLRQRVIAIFDQTFAVTGVLRVIALGVAVLGVVLSLLVLVIERSREISLLRALGAGRGQVTGIHLVLAACPAGVTFAIPACSPPRPTSDPCRCATSRPTPCLP
jgi:putative ABC transport system permease protein